MVSVVCKPRLHPISSALKIYEIIRFSLGFVPFSFEKYIYKTNRRKRSNLVDYKNLVDYMDPSYLLIYVNPITKLNLLLSSIALFDFLPFYSISHCFTEKIIVGPIKF